MGIGRITVRHISICRAGDTGEIKTSNDTASRQGEYQIRQDKAKGRANGGGFGGGGVARGGVGKGERREEGEQEEIARNSC